jgi:hypothetical protein
MEKHLSARKQKKESASVTEENDTRGTGTSSASQEVCGEVASNTEARIAPRTNVF